MTLTEGQTSNYQGAALLAKGITPCIPPKKNRKIRIEHDKTIYKQRHKIENMFGRLKDWRRITMRYDRCAHTFFSAICNEILNLSRYDRLPS